MKYDSILAELKNLLPNAKNILIALPAGSDVDKLAGGLSLYLSLKQSGKDVSIVCEDTIKVSSANLFGVDNIKNSLPAGGSGNYVITLEGVGVSDASGGRVPSLEKLDYSVEGSNLNLVLKVLPGQTFSPTNVSYGSRSGGKFDLIFVIGAANLNSLGSIYSQNEAFSGVHLVNIDSQANTSFGQTNIIDAASSSVSEILVDVIQSLGFPLDTDSASNLLTGIFDATSNLTNEKVGADTYLAVANCLRAGGKKPTGVASKLESVSEPVLVSGISGQPEQPQPTPVLDQAQPQPQPTLDLSMFMPSTKSSVETIPNQQPSPEERPEVEGLSSAETVEPEPGWLTPKIFKGTSAG